MTVRQDCRNPAFIEATDITGPKRITVPILTEHDKHFGKVWMTPDEFFCFQPKLEQGDILTVESFGRLLDLSFDKEYVRKLRDRMCNQQAIDPGWLDIDAESGRIVGHEGRTRCWVASQLGVPQVPIVIMPRRKSHRTMQITQDEEKRILNTLKRCGIESNRVQRIEGSQ